MSNTTISIFGKKIFLEIINETKLFSNYKIIHYEDLDLCINDAKKHNHLVIFFITDANKNYFNEFKSKNIPMILIAKSSHLANLEQDKMMVKFHIPFRMLELKKKPLLF